MKNFAPRGWAFCDGQLLAISKNQSLFSILGTTYGGDGRTSFGIPDLRGRVTIHEGQGPSLGAVRLGQKGGAENKSFITTGCTNSLSTGNPSNATVDDKPTGKNIPVNNMQPYLGINYIICTQGKYPIRN